jgi:hypothetical protein
MITETKFQKYITLLLKWLCDKAVKTGLQTETPPKLEAA